MNDYNSKLYQYGSDENEKKKLTEYWNKYFAHCDKCHGTRKIKQANGDYEKCECERYRDICLMMSLSMFDTNMLSGSMDTCKNTNLLKKAKYYVNNFFEGKRFCNRDGLIIFGDAWSGKTTMATMIIRDILELTKPYYISSTKTLSVMYNDLVRKSYDFNWMNQADTDRILYTIDWLLIDNVNIEAGQQQANKSSIKLLNDIIRKRASTKNKFTYFTLNGTIAEFHNTYGTEILNKLKERYVMINAGNFEFINGPVIL